MSALKDQDPDYGLSIVNNEKHQRIYEENGNIEIVIMSSDLRNILCFY